jgi:hypothetical protein
LKAAYALATYLTALTHACPHVQVNPSLKELTVRAKHQMELRRKREKRGRNNNISSLLQASFFWHLLFSASITMITPARMLRFGWHRAPQSPYQTLPETTYFTV